MPKRAIAIAVADIHLSHTPPAARAEEPDWYAAMARPLKELWAAQKKWNVPILCAGDVFDRWNSPPELISFGLRWLPEMWAIPGQHDLPYHGYDAIGRSAYWVMAAHGLMKDVVPKLPLGYSTRGVHVDVYAFPWGFPVSPPEIDGEGINIALIHRYVWASGSGHAMANKEDCVDSLSDALAGFDVAITGDNHIGFEARTASGCLVYNCGGFMTRKKNDTRRPAYGVVYDDGTVERVPFDTSQDIVVEIEEAIDDSGDNRAHGFVDAVADLTHEKLDFEELLNVRLGSADERARRLSRRLLDECR